MKNSSKKKRFMPFLENKPKWHVIVIHVMEGGLGQGGWFTNTLSFGGVIPLYVGSNLCM
jgi:hypothetical protein